MTAGHTNALGNAIAAAVHDCHASTVFIKAADHPDGPPVEYLVEFSHRFKVAACTSVDALDLAMVGLRAAIGGAA